MKKDFVPLLFKSHDKFYSQSNAEWRIRWFCCKTFYRNINVTACPCRRMGHIPISVHHLDVQLCVKCTSLDKKKLWTFLKQWAINSFQITSQRFFIVHFSLFSFVSVTHLLTESINSAHVKSKSVPLSLNTTTKRVSNKSYGSDLWIDG